MTMDFTAGRLHADRLHAARNHRGVVGTVEEGDEDASVVIVAVSVRASHPPEVCVLTTEIVAPTPGADGQREREGYEQYATLALSPDRARALGELLLDAAEMEIRAEVDR